MKENKSTSILDYELVGLIIPIQKKVVNTSTGGFLEFLEGGKGLPKKLSGRSLQIARGTKNRSVRARKRICHTGVITLESQILLIVC